MSTNNPSVQDLADLIADQGAELGLDDEASSSLIANLDATVVPMCIGNPFDEDEMETDDFRLLYFGFDGSSSMDQVMDELRKSFNDIIVPGLLEGAVDAVGAVRIGGLKFQSDTSLLWNAGFQRLTNQFPPLTANEISAGGSTALNRGILQAVTAVTNEALTIANKTGTHPEVVLTFLSDGANNNAPFDNDEIYKVLSKLSPELFTLVFIGFETFESVDFAQVARELGFRDIIESKAKPGESPADQRKRLRHLLGVYSEQLVGRVSTSQVGSGNVVGQSTGFWDPDNE